MLRFVLLWVVVSFSTTVLSRTLDEVTESGYIEIAVYSNFPPYSFLDEKKQPAGIDIELGKLIAAELGVEARWFWLTADETLEDDLRNAVWKGHYLNKRVADLMLRVPYDREYSYAIDGYGAPKHNMVVMFAPYHREQWALARDLDKVGDVRNLAIFQYQKIGVEIDSLPDTFLSSVYQGRLRSQVVHYSAISQALAALEAGELSGVAGMRSQIEWGLVEAGKKYDISAEGLEQLGKKSWDIGMAVKHTHRQLAYAIEAIIEGLVKNDGLNSLFDRFGVDYEVPDLYQDAADTSAVQ